MEARPDTEWPVGDANGTPVHGFAWQMRTWLRTGARGFVVDPRRRLGKHGGARKMLAVDGEVGVDRHGAWQGLVSALQRHTVHGELAQLSPEDRHILSLAYLSGYTNREIAMVLQVSVSTVGRRISAALARLEDSMRKAGAYTAMLMLLGLAAFERIASYVRNNRWPSTVALVAAGTATTVAVTFVVAPPTASGASSAREPAAVHSVQSLRALPPAQEESSVVAVLNHPVSLAAPVVADKVEGAGKQQVGAVLIVTTSRICHGNPTNAPPSVPVGPRGPHPTGPPVTTPGPGGCGHLNK